MFHIICILKSRFLSSNKLINCLFYLDIATLLYWRVALNCGNIFHWCRTAYKLCMSWCRPSSGCLSTVVQIVTHVACLIPFSTCVALAVYFAPVEVTSVARIFVGGKHPADVTQPCISRVPVWAVAGSWGSVSAPSFSRVMGGAPERNKNETVAPSGDHYCIDTVVPSSDHYGTTKVAPP